MNSSRKQQLESLSRLLMTLHFILGLSMMFLSAIRSQRNRIGKKSEKQLLAEAASRQH